MFLYYMCVVAVEMACLPDFFNHVSAKEHIAAAFSLGALAKDCLATCAEAQEANTGKRWHLCVCGRPLPHTSTLARLHRLPFGTGERPYTKNFRRAKQPVRF